MPELTQTLIETVKELAASSGMGGLRIFSDPRFADEVTLTAALVDAPDADDEVVENGGASLYLDPVAAAVLGQALLDARVAGGRVHLTVQNRP